MFWAKAVCDGRKVMIASHAPGEWEQLTKSKVQESIDARDAEASSQIQERMNTIKCSRFFNLAIDDDLRENYSVKHCVQPREVEGRRESVVARSKFISVFKGRS